MMIIQGDALNELKQLQADSVDCCVTSPPYYQLRVAWRIVKDWVEAQMAILESEMVTMDEIFLPYMIDRSGNTIYQLFTNNALQLNEPEEK